MQDFKHDLTSRGSESNCPVVITSFSSKIVAKTKCPIKDRNGRDLTEAEDVARIQRGAVQNRSS